MKVQLTLTAHQILYLDVALKRFVDENTPHFNALPQKEKIIVSIACDVADKLYTKAKSLGRATPKNVNKPHKITFKYHEAKAIHSFSFLAKDSEPDDFFRSVAHNIYLKTDPHFT